MPAPLAIRFLRLACSICGFARSFLVIDWISAICCLRTCVINSRALHLLGHFAHARHHAHDAFHAAHLSAFAQAGFEVVHVELTFLEPLHHALGLLGLDGFLRFLDQRNDVAHPKDTARDALGLKGLKRVHLFAHADELDRLAGDRAHGQRCPTATVAIHTREDNARDADLVVELFATSLRPDR